MPLTAVELAGQCLSAAGISMGDFCMLYIDEIRSVLEAAHSVRVSRQHDDWERMRLLATVCIMPHVTKRVTPQSLIPLPWDSLDEGMPDKAPALTREEREERLNKRLKQLEEYDSRKTTVPAEALRADKG